MSLALDFLPEAAAEAECVTGDYEASTPGLGLRFRLEIEVCAPPSSSIRCFGE